MKYKDYNRDLFVEVQKVFDESEKVFKRIHRIMDEVQQGPATDAEPEPWQKWFAWHPVKIKGKRRWMTTVYRRHTLKIESYGMSLGWEYGDMFDVLKEAGSGTGTFKH